MFKKKNHPPAWHRLGYTALLCLAVLAWAGPAAAQLPVPPSSQFDITGFLQEATLDGLGTGAHQGGHLKVNGQIVTVPAETIVIYPANALSWQELFAQAPAPWGIPGTVTPGGGVAFNGAGGTLVAGQTSGMARADCATNTNPCTAPPLTTFEVHVVGNRVPGATGGDQYIAGLIYVSQQGLNSGAGFINAIDYTKGEMRVGGVLGDSTTGARVRINDPTGRYTNPPAAGSTDLRFTVDADNPTIMSGTAYPMCLPRVAPTAATPDGLCPEGNRPISGVDPVTGATIYLASITTNDPVALPGVAPDATKQAPFEVGDYITFQGTLVKDLPAGATSFASGDGPTVGPMPAGGAAATYVSAHTIVSNVAIFTWPGTNPAYIETDVFILGTGGLTVLGAGEAAVRTRFEGMMTDPSRTVHLYGMDLNASTGAVTDRDWGTIGVDPGPPLGAVKGRWRFRPPCLDFGTVPTKPDKQCVYPATGTFLPPTREMRSVIEGLQGQVPGTAGAITSANGLFYGQYHAPILEYIFPENVPGSPIVENNFNAMPFLACGGYTSSAGTVAGVLNPWPSNVLPAASACSGFVAPPSAVAATATPSSVISGTGTLVTLSATASGTTPFTFAWTQAATDTTQVTLTNANTATATFTTPVVAANTTLNFTVTVTNSAGSSSAPVTVTVAVDIPIVNHIPAQTVFSGTPVTMTATCSDPNGLACTFQWSQTTTGGGVTLGGNPVVLNPNPFSGATINFTPILPVGTPSTTLFFTVVATNSAGVKSAPEFTSVTVNPNADSLLITAAEYRIGKQRLIVNVTDTTVSPLINLFLQPYLTESNTIYNPDPAAGGVGNIFVNNGGGLYTITLVGAPRPACNLGGKYATPCSQKPITVQSSVGGVSPASALTRIRQ